MFSGQNLAKKEEARLDGVRRARQRGRKDS
jgi:hypothetical protein